MAHLHSPSASFRSRTLSGSKRKLLCLTGLKEGIFFIDGDKRVVHSTYRATHYLIASSAGVSHLDVQPCGAHSSPNAEKPVHSEKSIEEAFVYILDRSQHGSPCRGKNNAQPSIGYTDIDKEEGEFDGFDGITILGSHSEVTLPLKMEPLPHCHANALSEYPLSQVVGITTSLGMQIPYLEIKRGCGVSEFCIGHRKALSTPDLHREVRSLDSQGLCNADAKHNCCMIKNVCNNDEDRYSIVLQENGFMSAFIDKGHFGLKENFCRVDNNDMGKGVLEESNIVSACIGSCLTTVSDNKNISDTVANVCNSYGDGNDSRLLNENDIMKMCTRDCLTEKFNAFFQKNKVMYTRDKNLVDLSKASIDCWRGTNIDNSLPISQLSSPSWCRILEVSILLEYSFLNTCDVPTRKNLSLQSFLTARCRLTLQKLFGLLIIKNLKWKVGVLDEQVIVYTINYLRIFQSRYLPARRRRRTIAASGYFRLSLHKHKGTGHYNMSMQVIVQDNLKCYLMGRITPVSRKFFSIECNSSGIEQACQYASTLLPKAGTSRLSRLSEMRDGNVLSVMESSSDDFRGFSRSLRGSSENEEQKNFEADESSHNLFTDMSVSCALKLQNLLEVRDGGMTSSSESPCEEMDEFTKNFKNSLCFPSGRSTNKVDDWTSIAAEQVDECLDTCLYILHDHPACSLHDSTPGLKLLDSAVMGNNSSSTCANNPTFNDGAQITDVYANGSENGVSCLPLSEPHSHKLSLCSPSLSFDEEELRSSLPYEGVHERQSREKLKHFAEGFLLRCHIRRLQQRAQQAPPYPLRGPFYTYQGASDGDLRTNPHTISSVKESRETNNEPAMTRSSTTNLDCFVGADVVIDIVGLVKYIESQCSHVKTSTDLVANSINYAEMPLIAGQVVISNFTAVIVTIIAIVVYTKTLLEGGLAWVGARTQKEEDS